MPYNNSIETESPFVSKVSRSTAYLQKLTGHSFQEFKSGEHMEKYFGTDPEPDISFEPPQLGSSRATEEDRARSRGDI